MLLLSVEEGADSIIESTDDLLPRPQPDGNSSWINFRDPLICRWRSFGRFP
jgi:hypothetical protein